MEEARTPPSAWSKVCRSFICRKKSVFRGTRDMAKSLLIKGGEGEAEADVRER